MAAWEPTADEPVGPKEMLGRRIFTDKIWEGSIGDAPTRFRVDHFYDSDPQHDFSVDRLGRASEEGIVVRQISRKAYAEGDARKPALPFAGWAACGRHHFATARCNFEIKPMPLADENNPYHAEIVRDEFRTRNGPYAFATMMRDVFSLHGHLREALNRPKPKKDDKL